MDHIHDLVADLTGRDQNAAYASYLKLREESQHTASVYAYFDCFVSMLASDSAYVRTRGLLLLVCNAKWDAAHRLDTVIDRLFLHLADAKPTVSRQLIAAMPDLARDRPDLTDDILQALRQVNSGRYAESMASLVQADIAKTLRAIRAP